MGTVYFAGVLKIIVSNDSFINRTVTPFQYNASSGQFANVQVEVQSQGTGCISEGTTVYGPHSLSVLITQFCPIQGDSQGSNGEANRNIIIGVVVGVVGCLILVLIGTGVGLVVVFLVRKKKLGRGVINF